LLRDDGSSRASKSDGDVVSWQPEVDEIKRREALARQMGGRENVERQHAAGRLAVRERRERIDALLDPGTFHEVGALAGRATYSKDGNLTAFSPSNFISHRGAARYYREMRYMK
jgi:acetyl-CoA carboxylase carboxyltransferase component